MSNTFKLLPSAIFKAKVNGYTQDQVDNLAQEEIQEVLHKLLLEKYGLPIKENICHDVDTPIVEFTIFPLLPVELRLKIWMLNLPGPRMLEVRPKPGVPGKSWGRYVNNSDRIVNLTACGEARRETLIYYKLAFASNSSPAQIYVNFEKDIILFTPEVRLTNATKSQSLKKDLIQIKFLAMKCNHAPRQLRAKVYQNLPMLKELIIVEKDKKVQETHTTNIYVHPLDAQIHLMPQWWSMMKKHFSRKAGLYSWFDFGTYPKPSGPGSSFKRIKVSGALISFDDEPVTLKLRKRPL